GQKFQRQSVRQQRQRKFVLFVTERGRDLLKKRFVATVIVDLAPDARGLFLQSDLGGRIQHAAHAVFRQISQRRLTTARPRQWNVRAQRLGQCVWIGPHLSHFAV